MPVYLKLLLSVELVLSQNLKTAKESNTLHIHQLLSIYLLKQIQINLVQIIKLQERIDYINSLTRDELKQYYKEILNNGEISGKGGGGLGFIDIAKKSGEKLVYTIRELDNNYSFFTLTVRISKIKKT